MAKVVKGVGKVVGSVVKAGVGLVGMLFKQPKQAKASANASTETRLNGSLVPEEHRKIVFGETACGTDERFWETYGANNNQHVKVYAAAGHELTAFGNLYLDEFPIPFSGNAASAKYAGQLTRRAVLKGVSGAGLTLGSGTRWTPAASMTGCAYFVLDWVYNQEKMTNGIPSRITQIVKGAKVFDPRRWTIYGGTHDPANPDTWEYTPLDPNGQPIGRNNALQMLAYELGIKVRHAQTNKWVKIGGRGVEIADIDFDSFITAANNCELERWYSDCILSTGDDHATNEAILEAASGGELVDVGGRFSYFVSVDDTADIAAYLTESDIVGPISWTPQEPIAAQFNELPGSFVDPAALFQTRPLPLCFDQAYYDQDGYEKRGEPLKLSAVQDPVQGQKLQRRKLNKSRFQGVFAAPFNLKGLRVRPWSNVRLTFEPFGWNNKLFRVKQQGIGTNGGIQLVLREEDPTVYLPGAVFQLAPPSAGYGGDASVEIPVVGLDAIPSGIISGNAARDTIDAVWALPGQSVKHTEIRYRKSGVEYWQTAGPLRRDQNYITIQEVVPLTTYEFQVRHVSLWNVPGAWSGLYVTTNAVTRNSAGLLVYADGSTVESLKPAGPNANNTQTNTAAAIFGQGPGATASAEAVLNTHVPYGVNGVVDSDMKRGNAAFGLGWNGENNLPITRVFEIGQIGFAHAWHSNGSTNIAAPSFDIFSTVPNDGDLSSIRRFALSVIPGDRLFASMLACFAGGAIGIECLVLVYKADGSFLTEYVVQTGGAGGYAITGDPAAFARIGGFTPVLPAGARYAALRARVLFPANTGSDGHSYAAQPMLCRVAPGQVTAPVYNAGPVDPLSDATALNISAGFAGQGSLATQSQADWASQVTGQGRPENYATNSRVYTQFDQPSSPSVNDVWVRLNSSGQTIAALAWNGSAWVVGADITGWNVSAGFAGQGALATQNVVAWASQVTGQGKPADDATKSQVFTQQGQPNSPSVNDIWVKLNGSGQAIAVAAWNGSTWIDGGNITSFYVAAGFNGQGALATQNAVTWASQVTGTGKPDDNATMSRVFTQVAAPTGQTVNDIWVKLNGSGQTIAVAAWNGSAWVDGGNVTSFYISAGIANQGPGATGTADQVMNARVPIGQNGIINSELAGLTTDVNQLPKGWRAGWGGNGTGGATWGTVLCQGRWAARVYKTGNDNGTVFDNANHMPDVNGSGIAEVRRYGVSVKPGEKVAFSARVAKLNAAETHLVYAWFDRFGSYITEGGGQVGSNREVNGYDNHPSTWDLAWGFGVAPANAAYVSIWQRIVTNGQTDPHGWMAEPMIAVVPNIADNVVGSVPRYRAGPSDPLVDRTSENTAGGIVGQGPGATASADLVMNGYLIGPNDNRVTLSGFERGTSGWSILYNSVPTNVYVVESGTHLARAFGKLRVTFTGAGQTASLGQTPWRFPVRSGERLAVQCEVETQGVVSGSFVIQYYNDAGQNVGNSNVFNVPKFSVFGTNRTGFARVPSGAVSANIEAYIHSDAAGDGTIALSRPSVTSANESQNLFAGYTPGPNSVPGSDPTGSNTAAGIVGQGPGATGTADQVLNDRNRLGSNQIVNSDLRRQSYAHGMTNSGNVQSGINGDFGQPYYGRRNTLWGRVNGNPGNNVYDLFGTKSNWNAQGFSWGLVEDTKRFGMPVKPGDRVGFRCYHGAHRCTLQFYCLILNKDGGLLEAPYVSGSFNNGGNPGNGQGYELFGFADIQHTDAAYAILMFRMMATDGQNDPYIFVSEEMLCKVGPGQTVMPPYMSGPSDPISDRTSDNIAGGIVGQGPGATQQFPYYAGMAAAIAAGLTAGQQFIDTTNGNKLTAVVVSESNSIKAKLVNFSGNIGRPAPLRVAGETGNFTVGSAGRFVVEMTNGLTSSFSDSAGGLVRLYISKDGSETQLASMNVNAGNGESYVELSIFNMEVLHNYSGNVNFVVKTNGNGPSTDGQGTVSGTLKVTYYPA